MAQGIAVRESKASAERSANSSIPRTAA